MSKRSWIACAAAMWMREAIERNPETRFVLLHCSYPWIADASALVRFFPNVYPDLSFLPLISTSACRHMLHDLIEGGTSDKVGWGCDTWTPEESYASLLAFRYVLVNVLAEKVEDGYFSVEDARIVIDHILRQNPSGLYRLSAL
ncbi:MAG TPA: amidohydrolase family protein [Anaerolineae bacterium]|nr:amidohydrolase family protein [Anaerolineae bacterium]